MTKNNENKAENEEENSEDIIPDVEIYPDDDDMEEEDCCERIDQSEIDEIFADSEQQENDNSNPIVDENKNAENSEQLSDDDESDVDDQNKVTNELRTGYGRTIKPCDILTYSQHQDNSKQFPKNQKNSRMMNGTNWKNATICLSLGLN
jgi:hypothetical protein